VNSPHVAQTLADYPAAKLAAEINTQIVEQAHRYVYATTDKPLSVRSAAYVTQAGSDLG
jgi:hypothetical protein